MGYDMGGFKGEEVGTRNGRRSRELLALASYVNGFDQRSNTELGSLNTTSVNSGAKLVSVKLLIRQRPTLKMKLGG